jgi:hypothetical protein
MEGVLVFKQANVGSKSEMLAPYLYVGEGKFERVKMLGENPFMPSTLNEYDGLRVKVSGEYNDDGVLMIETVERIDATAQ